MNVTEKHKQQEPDHAITLSPNGKKQPRHARLMGEVLGVPTPRVDTQRNRPGMCGLRQPGDGSL
jgi:hypothetical protein